MKTFPRRTFLKSAAASSLLCAAGPLRGVAAPAGAVLQEVGYGAAHLTGGPLQQQYLAVRAHYLALDNDRLLKVYRQRAGLPAPGVDMGGWYDRNGFVPGHALGQYISGLARLGASTGDQACRQKVQELVRGFTATLGAQNQSILRPESNQWVCYTLDKHLAGLVDAVQLAGVTEAQETLLRTFAGARALLPSQGRDRIGKKEPPYDETYVMPETLFAAHALTGEAALYELAQRYLLRREFFEPLARGDDPFPGQHAHSHAIALSSGGRAYFELQDARYRDALQHAFTLLTTQQQYASGGWGPNETFITPGRGELYASLSTTVDHFETPCGAYAATKLARYLLRMTGDSRYADYLERVVYNTILAVRMPDDDGDYPYYSTYGTRARKTYYPSKWPCCSGTLVQTVADYVLNLYFTAADGVYVSMYAPSVLTTRVGVNRLRLVQETSYPASDEILIRIDESPATPWALHLRIPAWASGASVAINGTVQPAAPGRFLRLARRWKPGDSVRLVLPQSFRTESIDELHPETAALMRGSVLYASLNATTPELPPLLGTSTLHGVGPSQYQQQGRLFVPFYTVQQQTYSVYHTLR
ncbi:MAG: glycoside hydrolase family 127 protein [Acidobacteriota bacterium]|nr:glycoside hydrolase family 127 protein [Acidobacteriota bacterium]